LAKAREVISVIFKMTEGLPTKISDTEQLGRAVFDTDKAKRAARDGQIAPRVFQEKLGVRELSVDRLSFGHHSEIAAFQDEARGRACRGWAVVTAEIARRHDRDVQPQPLPKNPYHGNIILPLSPEDEALEAQKEHALELTVAAIWMERPSSTAEPTALT
jgi:hypothetical protein